jgi:glyceraldehyde-3-phosphate dehydrogenase (NADP+)
MKTFQKILNTQNYIDGQFIDGDTILPVYQKYSQELLANIKLANEEQVEKAIIAVGDSFHIFKKFSAEKRAGILQELYNGILQNKEAFSVLIAAEAGKPIDYAKSEVARALDNIETGIRATLTSAGKIIPMDYLNGKGKSAYTIREPLGPVLGITPFNFPLNLALHKLIPAIATGSSIILKPAPQAPLTLMALASFLHQTELPKGAVNILMTTNELTQKMVEDDRLKILSFTGSDKIGWMLKSLAGKKKVLLEMGGNAAAIIDTSADLKRAAKKLAYGSYLNAGQICISTQRIYVLESVFDEFLEIFINETKQIKSGNMFENDVVNSSMISKNDLYRIVEWVEEAIKQGAKILYGGYILDEKHHIYSPTILTNTLAEMKIVHNEAFAPVVTIEKVKNIKNAVKKVNESRYGLQAAIFTNNLKNSFYALQNIDAGGIIINDIPGFRIDGMPYGGIKDSGMGREGAFDAINDYTETKLVVISPV